ncbi:aspartate ammonia-lyase [Candidatus Palibaumannia cicadellinicola]|uniref:Aspartate ammonia-lyase n=1 Tax=Baumannia cicadellinicola subsp. Homalodisca coagulata TaxID=374463 RepID=Q1LSP3_BAUCH|nr:aspartate ammonia-lyase [Candidatus Baumannia cicadellinicola]ABF14275.1 aspartate ammonia-lyase [Baumannia cicadellinicola str. Hc (Homalodisca coagulata)]MCJ7461936.1 aspartate ammonia-lyase [Candidatus Baumannia cicadellinicola]MCJ7463110.1 aspartate ammonia-lyase [Candidatus Baumannia cicadellinicola]
MVNTIRVEEDLLGTREIPANAYYGIHTLRACENFALSTISISDIPELVRSMVIVKKAAALANKELKILPNGIADLINRACDEILVHGRCMDQFPVDVFQGGAGTSINMNTNEVLSNIGLELMGHQKGEYQFLSPHDHLNLSQSTNDSYPTGLRLAIYNAIQQLRKGINHLSTGFEHKAKTFATTLKMGRTQLQDAVPMTLGQEFHAFNVLLKEEDKNLIRSAELLLEVNLGATAIGTRINTPEGYQNIVVDKLAKISGLPFFSAEDLIEATSDCGAYVMVHSALKRLAVKLSKICNDLRLLSSGPRTGLNEINLPQLQAGSSIMPAKVNPVIPEVVNQVCFKVIGNDTCVTIAAEAGQLQLNVMEPVISQAMFESISLLTKACYHLQDKCIFGISANNTICEQYVFNSIGIITYLNPVIGHHNGDKVGKICNETGKSVRQVVLELGLLTERQLDDIFSWQNLISPRYNGRRY